MWFNVDFNKLVIHNLPTILRNPKYSALVKSFVVPIQNLHYNWLQKRSRDWYKINHTGQVCFLRKALNDELDPSERRIYIGDGNSFPRKYIYTMAENKPVYIGTLYIYQKDEFEGTGADFIVNAPQEIINTKWHELNSIINFYKLASKRYQIVPIV